MVRDTKESVALLLAATVALFVIATLVVVFVLALNGVGLPDVWTSLFGLVIAVVSALAGWMARGVTGNGKPLGHDEGGHDE